MDAVRAVLAQDPRARLALAASVGLHLCAFVAGAAALLVLARTLDLVFVAGRAAGEVTGLLVALVAAASLRGACLWSAEVLGQRGSDRLRSSVRADLLHGLFDADVSPAVVAATGAADATVSVGPAVEDLDGYVTGYLPALVLAALAPVLVLGVVLVLDPWSTLVLLFAGPMLVLLLALIGGRTRELTARRLEELGWLSSLYLDLITGLATLKANNRSADAADRVEQVSRAHGDTTMEVLRTAFQTSLVLEWGATAATALVAVEVGFRLVGDHMAFGTALAVLVLVPEFFAPLRRLAAQYHAGHAGSAAWSRLGDLREALDLPQGPRTVESPGQPPPTDGGARAKRGAADLRLDLALRDVVVEHPGSRRPALDGFDLTVADGETVALVGPSGAGKSTVISALLGLCRPTSGVVRVGGVELGSIELPAWHRRIAWVPQGPTLLAGTVGDNIRLGRPDASDEEVRAAAAVAAADRFVEGLVDGYDTVLGEAGLRLSGGQRQRLAVARAVLRDAPLVLLDEFTAHLDPAVEEEVADAVAGFLTDRTAVVVAHRARTARVADRIVVVESGRVRDVGTHSELQRRSEAYRRFLGPTSHEASTSTGAPL